MDYQKMSISELEKEKLKMATKITSYKDEQTKLVSVLNQKIADLKVREKFNAMPEDEKKAMAQVIAEAGGIDDGIVGTPGASDPG